MSKKRPCSVCGGWFQPDARVKDRQRACSKAECQTKRRAATQASWRSHNREYASERRLHYRQVARDAGGDPGRRLPAPLDRVPWEVAEDQFGAQGADFIAYLAQVQHRVAKDQWRSQVADSAGESEQVLPGFVKDQSWSGAP